MLMTRCSRRHVSWATVNELSFGIFHKVYSVKRIKVHSSLLCFASLGVSSLYTTRRFASSKLARLYTMELNKARSEYRRTPTRAQQEECLRAITDTPLHLIQGLDGKTVAHCLSTLAVLDAPRDLSLLHDCAVWLSVHPNAFSSHSLAQSLYSLTCLEYPDTPTVLREVQKRILSDVNDMAPSTACMMLAVVLTACAAATCSITHGGQIDLLQKLSDIVLRAVGDGLGLTEKVMVAVALGKVIDSPFASGLISNHTITHLSAALWSSISEADLIVVSLADLAGLVSAVHTAPGTIREVAETALFKEFRTRVENGPLVSLRSAILVARALRHVICSNNLEAKSLQEKALASIEAYINTDLMSLDTATKLLAEFASTEEMCKLIPSTLVRYLVRVINEGREKWNGEAVHIVLRVFSKIKHLNTDAKALALLQIDTIKAKCAAGIPVDAKSIAALLVEGIVDSHAEVIATAVSDNIGRWSVSNVLTFLRAASEVNGKPTRAIMRDMASKLVPYIEKATAAQVAAVISSYGKARVRNDAFCESVIKRATMLLSELTLHQISTILGGLAAVEYRDTKLFVDIAPVVIAQASVADATQTATLLAAYSKMLIWNFRVIWSLAERAAAIHEQFTLPQILAVVMSLNRMDVQHPSLMNALLQKTIYYASDETASLSLTETVMILSAFSRSGVWDATFFEDLGKRVVKDQQQLTADELAETLMSFARVGLVQYNIFEKLTLRSLAMAPTSPLMPLAQIAIAYAVVGYRHEELFSIIADRFVNQKTDAPAVTIASVLSAFATIGIRNDRLFIEAIPRVRHVAQYGTPKDITNVVYAYAQVGLWHYKLFLRLADRAIQLRGEFRCDHLARLLEGYARVDMRYEKLFVEFSSRIQTVAHLFTASEVTKVVTAYAKVRIPDTAVFNACGDRAAEVVDLFKPDEAQQCLVAFRKANVEHEGLMAAFTKKFPGLVAALPTLVEVDGDDSCGGEKEVEEKGERETPASCDLEVLNHQVNKQKAEE